MRSKKKITREKEIKKMIESYIPNDIYMEDEMKKEKKNQKIDSFMNEIVNGGHNASKSDRPPKNFMDEKIRKPKKKMNLFLSFLFTLMLLSALVFVGYALLFGNEHIKQTELIINSLFLLILSFCMMISYGTRKTGRKKRFAFLSTITMIGFIGFNLLINFKIVELPQNSVMKDFTGKSVEEVLNWAEKNNIQINQVYENSEIYEMYAVVNQDIYPNTLLKNVKEVHLIVSDGPDYNKLITLPDMVEWNIDEAEKTIERNFLRNVSVDFIESKTITKDTIISQSKRGTMHRNDELLLKVSLGDKKDLQDLEMIDLKGMSEFKSLLWLKRNGIPFEIKREFSDKIEKGKVLKQSVAKDKMVGTSSKVLLTISKGRRIVVPDLLKMNSKNLTKWIIKNKLKVEFSDQYDQKIKAGSIVQANYKEKDEIEEGTVIKIVTSKGKLILPAFKDLQSFRTWAEKYNILYREEYQQSKEIESGNIIGFSVNTGDAVNIEDEMVVYISSGSTITIPNFIGKKKSDIEKTCKDLSINCTFYYAGASTKEKDIALSQNKRAGSEVVKNTYVNIGLSSKKTDTNPNINTDLPEKAAE